jgi:enoyl-CoA hydratase
MSEKYLRRECRGGVLVVRIANPPEQYFTIAMLPELTALCDEVESDPHILAVIITGDHPDMFLSHLDPSDLAALAEHPERFVEGADELSAVQQVFNRLSRVPPVTIAALNGHAWGAGCELALACDLRYMIDTPTAGIAMLESTLGLTPGAGAAARLRQLIGPAQAFHMLLTAQAADPSEALRLGLVHAVLPADGFVDWAIERARRLGFHTRESVQNVRRCIYGSDPIPEATYRLEQEIYVAGLRSETAVKRARRFLAHRGNGNGRGVRTGMPDFLLNPVFRARPELIIKALREYFDPERAQGIRGTYCLEIVGRGGGTWTVTVADDDLAVERGDTAHPDVTLSATTTDWVDFVTGRVRDIELFVSGRMRVYGDLMCALEFESLFLES